MGNLFYYNSDNWTNNGGVYPNIGIPKNFTVEDYEVFQVIKQ